MTDPQNEVTVTLADGAVVTRITEQEFKTRFANRMIERGVDKDFAEQNAEIALEEYMNPDNGYDYECPEDLADEEMYCWSD